jgi:hypothetical protein
MGQEAALVFSTGYQTNLGIIATLAGRGSVVIQDKLNHASLVDGAHARRRRDGPLPARRPDRAAAPAGPHADAPGGVLIVTDGVFSMEGNIVDLPGDRGAGAGVRRARHGRRRALVGVLGEHGRRHRAALRDGGRGRPRDGDLLQELRLDRRGGGRAGGR